MADRKYLWLDTETTGLDPEKNGLIEIAGLVEINGKVEEDFVINSRMFEGDVIAPAAAALQGLTVDEFARQIDNYHPPKIAFDLLKSWLMSWVDRYEPDDKFTVAGYNPQFDVSFVERFFRKMGDPYCFSYIRRATVDVLSVARFLSWVGVLDVKDHKLETVCSAYGIMFKAHTALDDIIATRQLALAVREQIVVPKSFLA